MSYINDSVMERISLAVMKGWNCLPINPSWSDKVCHAVVHGVCRSDYSDFYIARTYVKDLSENNCYDLYILLDMIYVAANYARNYHDGSWKTPAEYSAICHDLVEKAVHLLGNRPS